MRKLTGAVFQSLDGVMQAPGGPDEDPDQRLPLRRMVLPLLGREPGKAVRQSHRRRLRSAARQADLRHLLRLLAQQPGQSDRREVSAHQQICADAFRRAADLGHSHKLSGDTAEAVAELKRSEGRDLLIQGSSTLYPPLLSAGLIDRLVVMVFPVVLGRARDLRRFESVRLAQAEGAFDFGQGRRLPVVRAGG